ncbi:MAG: hypothetical protein NTZ09_11645 [Candidatus Hydrogenedentes bacterium]|nr:hypothetical protein [Candidatus Hydrogenedentota bacterium]
MPATTMVDRVVKYVLSMRDQLAQVRLEEAAICSAYGKSASGFRERSRRSEISRVVKNWLSMDSAERPATFGRRQQLLLRVVINLLLSRGVDSLSWDETGFLCEAFDLAVQGKRASERLRGILEPHAGVLRMRREARKRPAGADMLETRVRLVFPEQLEESARRPAPLFPGQPRPPLGPTLEAAGPVRVIGGIPDDCTVLVTGGPCSVDGYLLGRLGVSDGCDISENIAGSVVAASGNVRCRNIIEKAFVVAKSGTVKFVQAMNPQLVFGGARIVASDSISRGLFYGADIKSGNLIRGGTFHVTGRLSAKQLMPDEACPLNIVLRTAISFEEYGEQLGSEALHLRARAAGIRRKLMHLGNMVRATQAEAEHAASTIVLRAFSDLRLMNVLEERGRAGRRVAVLNRLIGALQELYAGAEEALAQHEQIPDELTGEAVFSDIEQDLDELARDGAAEAGFAQEHEQIRALYERLGWLRNDRTDILGVLGQLRDQMEAWIVERQGLNAQLDRLNGEVNRAVPEAGLEALAQRAKQDREPKLAALQRKIMALKNNPPTADVQRKLQAPLVQLMINMMQRRIQRLNELGVSIKTCKHQLAAVSEELQAKYRLGENTRVETTPATATGRFAAGVRIYRDAYVLEDPKPAAGAVLKTPDSGENTITYQRGLACVIAVEPEAEPSTEPPPARPTP